MEYQLRVSTASGFQRGPWVVMVRSKYPNSRVSRSQDHSEYGFWDLKPYYLGTQTLWGGVQDLPLVARGAFRLRRTVKTRVTHYKALCQSK